MALVCVEVNAPVVASWTSGSDTHVFPAGVVMPVTAAAGYLRLGLTAITGVADINTFYQPIGGVLAALGPPHPLGNVAAPGVFDWALPDLGGGTVFVNVIGHGGGATTITTDAQACYYQTATDLAVAQVQAEVTALSAQLATCCAQIYAAVHKVY